ncbi:MAG: hypothetical protein KatS3mg032_1060 [Cyclobacteriaceae bacterium]|nr:MAG: hypothetical protein KatS3mg032_1060 [Cyclobacteriaceae bacterium]
MPRYYDPQEEERKDREARLRREVLEDEAAQNDQMGGYRTRIAGSFRSARRMAPRQADFSAGMLRFVILLFLVLWLMLFIKFGVQSAYILLLFIPLYFFFKLRRR